MNYSKVKDGVVVNSLVFEQGKAPDDLIETPKGVGIGDLYDGSVFTKPAPPPMSEEEIIKRSKSVRDSTVNEPIDISGSVFQVNNVSLRNIKAVINNSELLGETQTTVKPWQLLNNTMHDTPVSTLNQILQTYDSRLEDVWNQYNIWYDGDRSEVFSFS